MPKRTNAFQKLVLHMQTQLSEGCVVTESAFLREGITGDEREVDVVIRKRIAGTELIIGVECLAQERPASVEWVERMMGKHQALPTDALILVSASGFTAAAKRKAAAANIRSLAIGEAAELDWTTIVGKLSQVFLARFDFRATGCKVTLVGDTSGTECPIGPGIDLVRGDGSRRGTVMDSAHAALHDPTEARDIMSRMDRDGTGEGTFTVTFHQPTFAVDTGGTLREVEELHFTFSATRATKPIDLRHGTWNGTPVAYGEGDTAFGKTFLALEELGPTDFRGTVTFVDEPTGKTISRPLESSGA